MKLFISPTLILAALMAASPVAPACAGVPGLNPLAASLPEQIVQEGTLINQLTQTITQTSQQLQMLVNQIKNLQSLPTQLWPNISSQIAQLINIAGQAQGLTYASMNTASQVQMQYGNASARLPNYSQSLQQWTTNLNSQVASILRQYGFEANNFSTEQSALQGIQNASQSAVGRLQVLQAGNQISGMMVNQLQLLRGDILSGNQVMMNAMANQANQEQQDRNNGNAWIKSNSTYQTTY
ncbi:MAG: P-type conjugative transfer protein TrbJ [Thiobacillaceae bacterium]